MRNRRRRNAANRRQSVVLVTEGAYPYAQGGVTTWCDQLIRGLPEVDFVVAAVCGTGREDPVIALPGNVTAVQPIPVWGPARQAGSRLRRRRKRRVTELHRRLIETIYLEDPRSGVREFLDILRELQALNRRYNVGHAMRSESAVVALHDVISRRRPEVRRERFLRRHPLSDALRANDLLDHFLRALWAPPIQADLVHCVCDGLPVLQALAAKWSHNVPYILSEHGVYMRERYLAADVDDHPFEVRDFVLRFMRLLVLGGYQEAAVITPVCSFNRRWELRLGADPDVIEPIYNGIDPGRFPLAGPEPDVPTITWVGRIDPLKDVETLIAAFAGVHTAIPEARLRLFGPVPHGNEAYAERCHALVHRLKLDDVITFEGPTSDVASAYASGHTVVLSSLSEAFPYTVIETMACGRAPIGTDVGGVAEAIGDAGLIVPPRDPSAMAEACILMLTDDELRNDCATRARERALEQFTLNGFLATYREVYNRYLTPDDITFARAGRAVREREPVAVGQVA